MPQIKTITLTDGTTPVDLTPDSNDESGFRLSSTSASFREAQLNSLISLKRNGRKAKHYIRLNQPLVRTTDAGEEYVIDSNIFEGTFSTSYKATNAEKAYFVALILSLLGDADVQSAVENQKAFY